MGLAMMVSGCDKHSSSNRDFNTDFELDAHSFGAESLELVGQRTGVTIPDGSHGLNLLNKGRQSDPSFIAKIEIPALSQETVAKEIERFPKSDTLVINSLAGKVSWWRSSNATVRLERQFLRDRDYVHALLCEENGKWILYLEWAGR